ncbi:MAG TPA: acetate--CoA ligase family protein [Streptosporangiaceae bacterium]|jgi:acyl-CoA synthetase (NDP forming)
MLEARSIAIVGASARPDSFGSRMLAEVGRSPSKPSIYPVNPRYQEIDGARCYPSLAGLPGPVDLVLLGVPDAALEQQLELAAEMGCSSGLIFGNAHEEPLAAGESPRQPVSGDSKVPLMSSGRQQSAPHAAGRRPRLRQRLAGIARSAGMELCGAGCMGFANVTYGLRAMGYVEPDPLPPGSIALVTHSGSVFSALLRTRRAFGFTLTVSSGQELVTSAPSYLEYALAQPETKVLALVLEAIREPDKLRSVLDVAAERDVPVILLTAGQSASGRAMVAAHSGALAGSGAGWEALVRHYGIHRVSDLAELADTAELFALLTKSRRLVKPAAGAGRGRANPEGRPPGPRRGIATVHDSGLERAHAADIADELGVPFAQISERTQARLVELLDPGLLPTNPLDVWGTGGSPRELFGDCLQALADDESIDAVALAVDLVTELDGDDSYQQAVLDVARRTGKPVAVISNLPSAIDPETAELLRRSDIPVLESMRTGLLAFKHLLARGASQDPAAAPAPNPARKARALRLLDSIADSGQTQLQLLAEYGLATAQTERVTDEAAAAAAAGRIGYPVVLKTDEPGVAHKTDSGGVKLAIPDEASLKTAYADLAARLGPAALICQTIPAGVELALGLVRDPDLGPLVVVGAGGVLVELIADRAVALPPLTKTQAAGLLASLKVTRLLAGHRGAAPADLDAITTSIVAIAELASELGDHLEALDVNPLICGPHGAIAVDALVLPR